MDYNNMQVKSNVSYPEIKDAVSCPKTIRILKNLMSGSEGELKGVLQYFYQSSICKNVDKEISNILEEISIVEMLHLSLLSHAIVDFGGEPRYENSAGQFFNTNTVNYSTKLRDILDKNIIGEERAIESYSQAIENVDNYSLKELLRRIMEDEKLHIKILNNLRDRVKFMSY